MARNSARTSAGFDVRVTAVQGRVSKTELRRRGEALVAKAVALEARIARDFWELGRLLVQLREESVHIALGYERLEDLIDERLGLARTAAWKLMAIAEQLPRAEAVKLGQEKAYALVTYAKSAPAEDDPATLVRNDAEIGGKPLSQASVRDVLSAAAAARPKRPRSLAERERKKADNALLAALKVRLSTVGIPKAAVSLEGERIIVALSRSQAKRILA